MPYLAIIATEGYIETENGRQPIPEGCTAFMLRQGDGETATCLSDAEGKFEPGLSLDEAIQDLTP